MNQRIICIGLCAGLLGAGCINHTQTVYRDVERTAVEFESDGAARLFYETLTKRAGSMQNSESRTSLDLPIIFSHERKVITGKNVEFNHAVTICDSNKDGRITETEARIFANLK